MATGKRLLNNCMPENYKQGSLYPTHCTKYNNDEYNKPYGNRHEKNAGHIRKAGQNKVRKQLKIELNKELEEYYLENYE